MIAFIEKYLTAPESNRPSRHDGNEATQEGVISALNGKDRPISPANSGDEAVTYNMVSFETASRGCSFLELLSIFYG